MNSIHGCHVENGWKLGTMNSGIVSWAEIPEGILEGFWENLRYWTEHFPPLEEPRRYGAVELFMKHYEPWMIIILVLEEHDFLKGVHIVIITIIEFWTFVICELPERGGMSPFLAAGKPCDDELVIEDFWGVPIFVHNIFYMSRLFLSKDALIEFDVFPWVFWEKMPSFGQYFLWQS